MVRTDTSAASHPSRPGLSCPTPRPARPLPRDSLGTGRCRNLFWLDLNLDDYESARAAFSSSTSAACVNSNSSTGSPIAAAASPAGCYSIPAASGWPRAGRGRITAKPSRSVRSSVCPTTGVFKEDRPGEMAALVYRKVGFKPRDRRSASPSDGAAQPSVRLRYCRCSVLCPPYCWPSTKPAWWAEGCRCQYSLDGLCSIWATF
jgi:hypothetical protein